MKLSVKRRNAAELTFLFCCISLVLMGCDNSLSKDHNASIVKKSSSRQTDKENNQLKAKDGFEHSNHPYQLMQYVPETDFEVDDKKLDAAAAQLWPKHRSSLSTVIHALHAFENYTPPLVEDLPSLQEMKTILLDNEAASQWYGNRFVIVKTSHGLRYVTSRSFEISGQAHIDQTLAVLAELEVPMNEPVSLAGNHETVKGFLDDTTANFQLRGEFEWSALSLLLYYPERREWTNRFGESFDVDLVARALMGRNLTSASCSGTHVLYTLAAIRQIDQNCNILSQKTRQLTNEFLHSVSGYVEECQLEDGSIDPLWNYRIESETWYIDMQEKLGQEMATTNGRDSTATAHLDLFEAEIGGKLLATSHHLEWLLCVPLELQPDSKFFEKSLYFLEESLAQAKKPNLRAKHYCPFTHTISVLSLFSRLNSQQERVDSILR